MSGVRSSLSMSALLAALGSMAFLGKAAAYEQASNRFAQDAAKPTSRIRRAGPVRYRPAAPYLQAAPKVDGVRMRWEKGRLVPRSRP